MGTTRMAPSEFRKIACTGLALATLACSGAPALGQVIAQSAADEARNNQVMARSRPDYDAVGIPAGGFRLFPSLEIAGVYDDNIYNTEASRQSDFYAQISPRVTAQSNWSSNRLIVSGGGEFDRYAKKTTNNSDQYDISANGTLDVTRAAQINLTGGYARKIEPRGTLGDIFSGSTPVRYDLGTAGASASVQFAQIMFTISGGYANYNYLPVTVGQTVVTQNYRDRNEYNGGLRSDFSVGPIVKLFVSGAYTKEDYSQTIATINQNSQGFSALGGVALGKTGLLSGEIGIGYLKQYYAEKTFKAIGGFSYNAHVTWNPTQLLTVTATARRTIQQSPFVSQTGILEDSFGAHVDYELLRNVILSAEGDAVFDNYSELDRKDRLYTAEGRARYLFSRWLEAGLSVSHRFQASTSSLGRRYAGSSVLIGLTFKR